ncbi:hypothetical protein [Gynuella sp.]|uniref:hypothetical protein n=1 Tax=Gynuella sp. TaxID=2969146 RepID=UPI003D09BB10
MKRAKELKDPWKESSFKLGLITTGNVVLVAEFGYLIKLENKLVATMKSGNKNKQYMKNDQVNVQVSHIDFERKKIEVIDIG